MFIHIFDSLSLSLSSPFSLHNGLSLSSHLSLTVGYFGVGHGSGVEVRLGKSKSVWYGGNFWVFWVQSSVVWSAACLSFFRHGLQCGFLLKSVGKPSCTSHGSARLGATSMRSASMSSSWSEWSFGFYWSQVVKFRIFLFMGFVDWCVFGWSIKFWVFELIGYCWILFELMRFFIEPIQWS